jgi:radical SAM superfamily enzyme YgiQ (UPF0313 family)
MDFNSITKILDKIPLWKTLKELPLRLEQLEKEINLLKKEGGKKCPFCSNNTLYKDPQVHEPLKNPLDLVNGRGIKKIPYYIWKCHNKECGKERQSFMNLATQKFDE